MVLYVTKNCLHHAFIFKNYSDFEPFSFCSIHQYNIKASCSASVPLYWYYVIFHLPSAHTTVIFLELATGQFPVGGRPDQKRFIYRLLTRHGCLPVFAGSSLIFQWKWTRSDLKLAVRIREF
jgi:hypothetical protein